MTTNEMQDKLAANFSLQFNNAYKKVLDDTIPVEDAVKSFQDMQQSFTAILSLRGLTEMVTTVN